MTITGNTQWCACQEGRYAHPMYIVISYLPCLKHFFSGVNIRDLACSKLFFSDRMVKNG